jgi:hypothetical protein
MAWGDGIGVRELLSSVNESQSRITAIGLVI